MHSSLRSYSARVHRPLISFVGKRTWPRSPAISHPHPAAPPEHRKIFAEPGEAPCSATKVPEQPVFQHFWEAPPRFWEPRLDQAEIDAVLTGGASLH